MSDEWRTIASRDFKIDWGTLPKPNGASHDDGYFFYSIENRPTTAVKTVFQDWLLFSAVFVVGFLIGIAF